MKLPTSCLATARSQRHSRRTLMTGSTTTLTCSLVIVALISATVISTVQSTSIGAPGDSAAAKSTPSEVAAQRSAAIEPAPSKADAEKLKVEAAAPSAADVAVQTKVSAEPAKASQDVEQARKGRSEAPGAESSKQTTDKPAASETSKSAAAASQKPADQKQSTTPASGAKSAATASATEKKSQLSGKSGATAASSSSSLSGKKLPANLGTVTSTGSGGPAHYMSKHDAYSAIAEKHGALAADRAQHMRTPDRRQHHASSLQQRFGGIQKASGLGDALNPFKGVTDSGLARTLGASMRSIIKGKYSVPAYLASAVLGAVALMAFYESPISPLPVPALPEPPVGRFPPEMPVIAPNLPVPFRTNQQQGQGGHYSQQYNNYAANQRSSSLATSYSQAPSQQTPAGQQQQQQQQQVLFPGQASAQVAQARQGSAPGPVQQLAANLISTVGAGVQRQTAQRKSGADHDASSSRSFFGSSSSSSSLPGGKLGAPANQQHKQATGGSSLLSFLGLGGGGGGGASSAATGGPSATAESSGSGAQQPLLGSLADIHRASGLGAHHVGAGGGPVASAPGHEHKGQSVLSNSHLVNKMKSYFDRPVAHSSWSMDHNVPNQYDQYRRMSIMQALAKDTAFLSGFFTPSRRSSNSSSPISASQLQQSINSVLSAASGSSAPSQQVAASRMQVDNIPALGMHSSYQQQPQQAQPQQPQQQQQAAKRASSGYGLMRAADRVAHTLLDTLTSGLLHRSSSSGGGGDSGAAAASVQKANEQPQNAFASATSLLSDIVSSYNAVQADQGAQHHAPAQQQQQQLSPDGKQQQQQHSQSDMQVSGRSADQSQSAPDAARSSASGAQPSASEPSVAPAAKQQTAASAMVAPATHSQSPAAAAAAAAPLEQSSSSASQVAHSRKTRSVGLEYPVEQAAEQPSRATQINNLVDYVSDSYKQNKMLFSFVMNQVGLSQALPYVDQFLGEPKNQ